MIFKKIIGNELYVYITDPFKKKLDLLYKRWLNKGYGVVMDRMPFTSKDIDSQKNGISKDIRDEMDADMEESGMPQGEIESCLNHWNNKYIIQRK